MPWSNQGGGPWQPKNPGPWGQGPQGGNNGSPDLEDLFRRSQEKLRRVLPGGGGSGGGFSGRALGLLGVGAVVLWLAIGGFYQVQPNQIGIETVFGRFTGITQPGLHYNWPAPIGAVYRPTIDLNSTDIGIRSAGGRGSLQSDLAAESLMLTGDENIVDVNFTVQWRVDAAQPQDFIFNLQSPQGTVRAVAESAMREVIGKRDIQPVLTGARAQIETEVQELMQRVLDGYKAGVRIQQVQMQKVDPPAEVIAAFREVQVARADQERAQNVAQGYANKVVPEARGEVSRIVQRAEGERERMIAEARGQAAQFNSVYDQYSKAPDVTRERLYLETMERVFGGTDKIILDQRGNGGVLPYLPLPDLGRKPQAQGTR